MKGKSPHPRADTYRQLRAQGLTYREIGEMYGVSHQSVSMACAQGNGQGFKVHKEKSCIYPNLRRWLNENRVSRAELVRRLGLVPYHESANRVSHWLSGRSDPPKWAIDKLLQITGMKYETLFYLEKTEEDKNQ